jgi:hypothetical protein
MSEPAVVPPPTPAASRMPPPASMLQPNGNPSTPPTLRAFPDNSTSKLPTTVTNAAAAATERISNNANAVQLSDIEDGFTSAYARLTRIAGSKPEDRQSALDQNGLSSYYEIDPNFNELRSFLVKPKATTAPTVAVYRYTDQNDAQDLLTDLEILKNKFRDTFHYKDAQNYMQRVLQTYDRENVHVAGFSLGASTAHEIGIEFNLPSKAFNPAYAVPESTPYADRLFALFAPETAARRNSNDSSKNEIYISKLDGISRNAIHAMDKEFNHPKIHYLKNLKPGLGPHYVEHFF